MEQKFHLVHEKKIRVVKKFHLVHEKKFRMVKIFKIVKRSCSLNSYYRVLTFTDKVSVWMGFKEAKNMLVQCSTTSLLLRIF